MGVMHRLAARGMVPLAVLLTIGTRLAVNEEAGNLDGPLLHALRARGLAEALTGWVLPFFLGVLASERRPARWPAAASGLAAATLAATLAARWFGLRWGWANDPLD